MMHWWLRHSKGEAAKPVSALDEGMFVPQSAETLLAAEHRKRLLARIWQYTALTQPQFDQLYLDPIRRYASYVQQLPASETHHHAYPGGMLDHGLELMACSLKLRQSHLLPSGSAPEDQAAEADAWSAAIAYGALLHDIGKIAVDIRVEYKDGDVWHPWHGPLNQPYRFRYVAGRSYQLHAVAAGLLYTQVLAPPLLDWLSGYPELWGNLLSLLADHYELAGTLGELVIQADRISTAQNIGANPLKALQAPAHSLQHHLLAGLRHLVKHDLKLNQPGAAGWLTQKHLWLVSKSVTDKLRAYLLGQGIEGIPSSNIAMFDELQSHALIEATSDGKAIWRATVSEDEWQQRFTFLRLQPSLIWADEERPPTFGGTVNLADDETSSADNAGDRKQAQTVAVANEEFSRRPPPPQDIDDVGPVMDLLLDSDLYESDGDYPDILQPNMLADDELGLGFIHWLRNGIDSHQLHVNDRNAHIHTVNGTLFLVPPGIFQRYAKEQAKHRQKDAKTITWQGYQRAFEQLKLHLKLSNGHNIWRCNVCGPRRQSQLNGYLLRTADGLCSVALANNPFLSLNEPK